MAAVERTVALAESDVMAQFARREPDVRTPSLTVIGDQSPNTLRDVATQIEQLRSVVAGLIRNADRLDGAQYSTVTRTFSEIRREVVVDDAVFRPASGPR